MAGGTGLTMWPIAIVGFAVLVAAALAMRAASGSRGAPTGRTGVPPALVRASLLAAILWLPFAWIITLEGSMTDYRRLWLGIWPALPGLPAIMAVKAFLRVEETWAFVAGGAFAALLLVGATALSGRGRWWFVLTVLAAIAYGCVMGPLSYALFAA